VAAVFDDDSLRVGRVALKDKEMLCLFNPEDTSTAVSARLERPSQVRDVWSGAALGRLDAIALTLAPRSARLLECTRG